MNGSRTIRVRKRDGSVEAMDPPRLAAAMWRGMMDTGASFAQATSLAEAIRLYLVRTDQFHVSSEILLRMVMKVLRKMRMERASEAIAVHRLRRSAARQSMIVLHSEQSATLWDKSWLAQHAERSWGLGRRAARIVAAMVEDQLMDEGEITISRQCVLERMNACVAALGLAGAMPLTCVEAHA